MTRFHPISPQHLVAQLVDLAISRHPGSHPLRFGFDAPRCAETSALVGGVAQGLIAAGTPAAIVQAGNFYRDASLRFEYGKTDLESFYSGWLDVNALQREVLVPLGGGDGRSVLGGDRPAALADSTYLPSLRDPVTNRSSRAMPASLAANGVLLLSGELLLGIGLTFDLTVHFWVSRQARIRRTAAEWAWTLPALDRYDIEVDPVSIADVVLRYDDPEHPAIFVR
ncbi:uridine kinase [Jatrophihabitans sp. DSM 45814]